MKKISFIIMAMFALVLTSCQDKDIEREGMALQAPDASQITGQLNGDDYTSTAGRTNAGHYLPWRDALGQRDRQRQ